MPPACRAVVRIYIFTPSLIKIFFYYILHFSGFDIQIRRRDRKRERKRETEREWEREPNDDPAIKFVRSWIFFSGVRETLRGSKVVCDDNVTNGYRMWRHQWVSNIPSSEVHFCQGIFVVGDHDDILVCELRVLIWNSRFLSPTSFMEVIYGRPLIKTLYSLFVVNRKWSYQVKNFLFFCSVWKIRWNEKIHLTYICR